MQNFSYVTAGGTYNSHSTLKGYRIYEKGLWDAWKSPITALVETG
jgi:hypothetical protein